MIYVLEALFVVALLALLFWAAQEFIRRKRTARALQRARWEPHVRSLPNNHVAVEVVRLGEATQVVAELNPAEEGFETQLYEAEARAENLAATLNAASRR